MYNIISTISVIYALSAGALTIPTSIDNRSGDIETRDQDAHLTILIWDNAQCTPTFEPHGNFSLSWGSMQNFPTIPAAATASFTISRSLNATERLDWSSDVLGKYPTPAEDVPYGCEHFEISTSTGPSGRDLPPMPLQGNTCTPLGAYTISVSVLSG